MVLPSANGTHPDGDPFAAADALRAQNTPLGRLEARAIEEQRRLEVGPPPAPAPAPVSAVIAPPIRSQRRTPSLYGTPRREENVPVVVIDDSDDEASQGKRAANGNATASGSATSPPPPQQSATSEVEVSKETGEANPSLDASNVPASDGPAKDDHGDAIMQDVSGSSTLAPNASPSNGHLASPHPPEGSPLSSVPPTPAPGFPSTKTDAPAPAPAPAPVPAPRARQRSPSPSPPPKPAPPPRTIRLALTLPPVATVTEVPEYSVAEMAREAGYGVEESEKDKEGSGSGSDSGSESEGGTKKKGKGKEKEKDDKMEGVEGGDKAAPAVPTKRKRAPAAILGRLGGYDVEDPFVDDSEIALYEPQWYHRPKRDGFFVCTGLLELIGDAKSRGRTLGSKNKPKYDKDGKLIPARRRSNKLPEGSAVASTSTSTAAGAKAKPASKKDAIKQPSVIVIEDDDDIPSVSSVPAFGAGAQAPLMSPPKKKKKIGGAVSDALQSEFDKLKVEIAKESFQVKSKFPPRLRPLLADVAMLAIELNEYDDDFFAALPKLLPYNLFTLKKLVKREIFARRMELFNEEQEDHLDTIRTGIAESLPGQLAEHEEAKKEWEEEQKGKDQEAGEKRKRMMEESMRQDNEGGTPEQGAGDATAKSPGGGEAKPEEHEVPEPKWKFRLSEAMKLAVLEVYTIEEKKSDLIIEKQTLEKSTEKEGPAKEKPYSILAAKKALYAKLAALWPDDLMTTNQLSREMSQTKKKVDREKERAAQEGASG